MAAPSGLAGLEALLGHAFHDPALLEQALTHRSWANEHPDEGGRHNERLEFLGDAVLGLVLAEMLMQRFPDQDEGALTEARRQLADEAGLAAVAAGMRLEAWVRLGEGEARADGRLRPRLLADTLEALVGALYMDGGPAAAFLAVRRLFGPRVQAMQQPAKRPKSRLQEHAQALGLDVPRYEVVGREGPDHAPRFLVAVHLDGRERGRGAAGSKRDAEQAAAEAALAALDAGGHGDAPAPQA